ncbi:ROK family protein [Polycladidibacter hongkongensis]|uniref:ROK family protein n=1 Tax=Polycladidibacter hongkongensis TaxID=1647556 RepID=UPI000833F337|nr:ROK family protein [Pseudovibrio hongkongensis]
MVAKKDINGIAVDFGGTKTAVARIHAGELVAREQVSSDGAIGVEEQVARMAQLIKELEPRQDECIGVAATGRIDSDGNWYAVNTSTLNGISKVPLAQMLHEVLGQRVRVVNDALAGALGEYHIGAGTGARSLGFITVSTGVGGGFILQGNPLMSANGLAGHVGFTTSRQLTTECGCGRRSTVESIAAGRALARLAAEQGHPGLDGRAVYEAALAGEPWAKQLVEQSAAVIAELCANTCATMGLDRIVLGGSVGLAQGFLELVRSYQAQEPELFHCDVVAGSLGQDSALLGALLAQDI